LNAKKTFWLLWAAYAGLMLYWAFRFWGHFPAFMDTLEYVFPEKWFNVESFRQGLLPLWNPYIACGTPHVANLQSAAFYPFFWLWNLTGLTDWFFVGALLHGAWATLGFYFWLRFHKVQPVTAVLCAMSFGGSGLMVIYWGFPTHLASLSWVPWLFLGAAHLMKKQNFLWFGLTVLFGAFQFLAGYPFFIFYAVLFLAVWMILTLRAHPKVLGWGGLALGLGLLLTACQWLPFLDFLRALHREGWQDPIYCMRWVNYLTLFQPQILGIPGTRSYMGDYPDFIFNNLYMGLVPLGLLLWSLVTFQKSKERFWTISALFWFFWIAGTHCFLWFFIPSKWLGILATSSSSFLFLFCALTALGLRLKERSETNGKKKNSRPWVWFLGVLWLLDILFIPSRVLNMVPDPYRDGRVQQAAAQAKTMTGEGRMVSLHGLDQYHSPEAVTLEDSYITSAENLTANSNIVWGLRSARGYLSIYVDGYQDLQTYFQKGFPYDGRVLDAAGIKLILTNEKLGSFKYCLSQPRGEMIYTQNAGAMEEAWQVERVREFPGRPEVFEALMNPKAFLENEVYTERGQDGKAVRLAPVDRILADGVRINIWDRIVGFWRNLFESQAKIQMVQPSPSRVEFGVSTPKRGFLVFDESYAPGWHAWVDGRPVPIFRANGMWMTVELSESGEHRVVFRYEPTSLRLGLFLTLITLIGFISLLILKRQIIFRSE
jgi:hypothetical protein